MELPNKRACILWGFFWSTVFEYDKEGNRQWPQCIVSKFIVALLLVISLLPKGSFCVFLLPRTCTCLYINLYHEGTLLLQVTFRGVNDGGWTARKGVFSKFSQVHFIRIHILKIKDTCNNLVFMFIFYLHVSKIFHLFSVSLEL